MEPRLCLFRTDGRFSCLHAVPCPQFDSDLRQLSLSKDSAMLSCTELLWRQCQASFPSALLNISGGGLADGYSGHIVARPLSTQVLAEMLGTLKKDFPFQLPG